MDTHRDTHVHGVRRRELLQRAGTLGLLGPGGHATLPWPLGATVGRLMEIAYQPKHR
jgi:hypothetical protein